MLDQCPTRAHVPWLPGGWHHGVANSQRETWWKIIVLTLRICFSPSKSSTPMTACHYDDIWLALDWNLVKVGSWSKNAKNVNALRFWMGLPVVENLSGLRDNIFSLFRSSQFNSRKIPQIDGLLLNSLCGFQCDDLGLDLCRCLDYCLGWVAGRWQCSATHWLRRTCHAGTTGCQIGKLLTPAQEWHKTPNRGNRWSTYFKI